MTTVQPPGRSLEGGSGGAADRLFRNGTRVAGGFLVVALVAIGLMLWLSSSEAFGMNAPVVEWKSYFAALLSAPAARSVGLNFSATASV